MQRVGNDTTSSRESNETVHMRWVVHPFRKSVLRSTLVVAFLIALFVGVYVTFESFTFVAISVIVLFCALSKFFFPTTYTFTESGVIIQTPFSKTEREWKSIRSYYFDRSGVLLSPFAGPSRLESFRGVYLILENNRAEVESFLKRRIQMTQDTPA